MTAIIAGGSAVGGGLIVAMSNLAVSWLQAREARKAEMRNALIAFGGVVFRIDYALRSEPKAGRTVVSSTSRCRGAGHTSIIRLASFGGGY
jgi:endo-alpha-1,4-polygalactosaminidase (GH114 family)